ncbi:MAG: hypothetical protein HFI07_08265 [Lachnospiraceae bacterium]|nr:hypothetical protein [Lachnospiraceae bacterium]
MAKKKDKEQKKGKEKRRGRIFSVSKEAKRRLIPPFVMLTAGAITSILMVVKGCSLNEFLARLLLILIIFYALGGLLKGILDMIDKQNAPPEVDEDEEDEMVEKEPEEESAEEEGAEEETAEE